jgi:acetylornithine deacetylase/succinyl-diaminopimelate desuccinylase-like protein
VLTEGGGTVVNTARGPVIGVAVGEKGMAPTRIVVRGRTAHASTPRAGDNALATAAEVVRRIEAARPATHIGSDWRHWVSETIDDEELRARLLDQANLWDDLDHLPDEHRVQAHACTHTTYTPTRVSGGLKDNIVPDEVTLGVDVRIVPGETTNDVQRFLTELLTGLPATVTITHRTEPSRSNRNSTIWATLRRAVCRAHPDGRLAPMLFTGGTDGRHLRALGVPVFGFGLLSATLDPATYWSRFHGDDERIDLDSLWLSTAAWEQVALDFLG